MTCFLGKFFSQPNVQLRINWQSWDEEVYSFNGIQLLLCWHGYSRWLGIYSTKLWPCWIFWQIVLGCASNFLIWNRPPQVWNCHQHFELALGFGQFQTCSAYFNQVVMLHQVPLATAYIFSARHITEANA